MARKFGAARLADNDMDNVQDFECNTQVAAKSVEQGFQHHKVW